MPAFEIKGATPARPFKTFRSLTAEVRSSASFDVLRHPIREIQVGEAVYRLRTPSFATFYPGMRGPIGRVSVDSCGLAIVGVGEAFSDAMKNWEEQFHVQFQTLLGKRLWEMTAEEKNAWDHIDIFVDVAACRRETPYHIRQIGWLAHRRPIPDRVRWEGGHSERVSLDQMPPEFAALHEGDRFEAEVVRDPSTQRMIRTTSVRRLPPLQSTPADEELWQSLPTSKDSPSVDWNEFE